MISNTTTYLYSVALALSLSFSQSVSLSKHTLWWTLREGYRLFCHCLYCKLFDFKHVLKLFYPRQRSVFRFCCSHHIFIHRHFYTHSHTHRPHFYNYLHTLTHLHSYERYLLCGIIFFLTKSTTSTFFWMLLPDVVGFLVLLLSLLKAENVCIIFQFLLTPCVFCLFVNGSLWSLDVSPALKTQVSIFDSQKTRQKKT